MEYVGIDVGKRKLVVAFSPLKKDATEEFDNTPAGIKRLINRLKDRSVHCVLEATGAYSMLAVYMLSRADITVSMENPLKIKNFARATLSVNKTDEADARLIALYGERMQPKPYKMPNERLLELKQKRMLLNQYKRQQVALRGLQEALDAFPFAEQNVRSSLTATADFIDKQIADMESSIYDVAEEEYSRLMKLLTSVSGIGKTLAVAMIVATGGFTHFENAKQFTRYVGLSPTQMQSGTSLNIRGRINKNGNPTLRGQFYVASMSALQHNKECKTLYQRLKNNGKPGKVAVVAVANKLIRQAFAVVYNNTEYIDGYVSTPPKNVKTPPKCMHIPNIS